MPVARCGSPPMHSLLRVSSSSQQVTFLRLPNLTLKAHHHPDLYGLELIQVVCFDFVSASCTASRIVIRRFTPFLNRLPSLSTRVVSAFGLRDYVTIMCFCFAFALKSGFACHKFGYKRGRVSSACVPNGTNPSAQLFVCVSNFFRVECKMKS